MLFQDPGSKQKPKVSKCQVESSQISKLPGGAEARPVKGWIQDSFKSWDGKSVFFRFYPVPGARHTVIMIHGYGEHSGRYEKFPGKMSGLSAQMAMMDLRGMGRSEGRRGDIDRFEDYVRDFSAFVEHLRSRYQIPRQFILLGHSMGALVAIDWAIKNPGLVKMLILSAPFFGLRYAASIRFVNQIVLFVKPKFVYKNPVRSRTLTHDPGEVEWHSKDPLILRHISARLLDEMTKRTKSLKTRPVCSVPFPVHMLVAGEERVVDPTASRRFFDRLVAPRKERTVFDGFFHEIFNERDQQKAFNVLKTIIEDCV